MKTRNINQLLLMAACVFSYIADMHGQDELNNRPYQKISELQKKLQNCHQKKITLLAQCDHHDYLSRIHALQQCIDHCETTAEDSGKTKEEKRREIALLQRTIAEHNRKLLESVPGEKKKQLKQLLNEYTQLWKELCQFEHHNQRQSDTFGLFFI